VRLIDSKGEQAGVLSTIKALEMAKKSGLDLVEVSPNADPPVCKIVVRTSGNDISQAGGEGNISFTVRTRTKGQSVYSDIALHISNYYVYCIADQNLTHTI
jgi:hypothetical protein